MRGSFAWLVVFGIAGVVVWRLGALAPAIESDETTSRPIFLVSTEGDLPVGETTSSSRHPLEMTPVVFHGRRLLLQSYLPPRGQISLPRTYLAITDQETGEKIARFGHGYSFGSALVDKDILHVFAAQYVPDGCSQDIYHFWSTDLVDWLREPVLLHPDDACLFNSSVCRDSRGYLMVYASKGPSQSGFRFARSPDLMKWEKIDLPLFAGDSGSADARVYCPVVRFFEPHYYLSYRAADSDQDGELTWRVTRSKDLQQWEFCPEARTLEMDEKKRFLTDSTLVERDGKTWIYAIGANSSVEAQVGEKPSRRVVRDGSMKTFFEGLFKNETSAPR